jgi:hemolysin-activating ACP:hemolysin acyltransferase
MNKYTGEYRHIVNELIKKSFPSLKNRKLFILETYHPIYYWCWAFAFCFFKINIIGVSPRTRKMDLISKKGLFVHELCHIENFRKNTKNRNFLIYRYIKFLLNKNYAKKNERQTDIDGIKKGYGREIWHMKIFISKKESRKMYERRKEMGYLTPQEIRGYIKKFKNHRNLRVK